MTDLQKWAESEISYISSQDTLCGIVTFLGAVSAPIGGLWLSAGAQFLNMKTKADEYYLAELYKIYQGVRFSKVTREEARRLFPT